MPVNDRGVYVYEEPDADATASQMLNRQATALTELFTTSTAPALDVTQDAAGWKRNTGVLLRMGLFRLLTIEIERTGAALTNPTNGNVANTTMASLLLPRDIPALECPITSGSSGRMVSGYISSGVGNIVLAAVGGTTAVATGETITVQAMWIAKQL